MEPIPSLALRVWLLRHAPCGIREGLPVPQEPALLTSAGRMPERSQHRVSEGQDVRSERPATGCGQPRPTTCDRHNLHTALPHASPPPKPQTTIVLPGPIRPVRQASSIASGIDPLDVLP